MSAAQITNETARFMMYFKSATLNELRVLSRMLNVAMVDFVEAAMKAYIFAREQELGSPVPARSVERYVGPRSACTEKRIRYVMKLEKQTVETMRDIAFLDSRRFTQVCDEALADFIRYTKEVKKLRNVWISRSDVEAVRGRKSAGTRQVVFSLLEGYKSAETLGKKQGQHRQGSDPAKKVSARKVAPKKTKNRSR